MLPLEVGPHAEHRAGAPLTLATMAGDDGIGIGGYFDTQGTTRAMRGSRHSSPPLSDAGRLQESGCQNDRLLSIVLMAPKSLAEDFAARRADAAVASLNRCRGMLRRAKRRRPSRSFEVRLDENLDGLFAGVDLNSNGVVAKVHLVASSVLPSDDGVGIVSL
jgi:hypothetical protein